MVDTYCDSERLRKAIVNAPVPPGNLYPHELAMVFYCSIGLIKIQTPRFAGCFTYQFGVGYPVCLLYSLIQRGYIMASSLHESVGFLKVRDMQRFVNDNGLKSSSKRVALVDTILSNFSDEAIRQAFPYDYYIPTDLGYEELSLSEFGFRDAYRGWEATAEPKKICESDIHMVNSQIKALQIDTTSEEYLYSLVIDEYAISVVSKVYNCPKRSSIQVKKNGCAVFQIDDVDRIEILHHLKILIFEKMIEGKASDNGFWSETIATGFDIDEEKMPVC